MKVLFVCRGNNCRSQMAEAMYNRLTRSANAQSAGTHVEGVGMTLDEFNKQPGISSYTVKVMHDAGYEVGSMKQKQLTKDMLDSYDLIVNMAAKNLTPSWLSSSPNYKYWKISDPKGRSYALTKHTKNAVEQKVRELLVPKLK